MDDTNAPQRLTTLHPSSALVGTPQHYRFSTLPECISPMTVYILRHTHTHTPRSCHYCLPLDPQNAPSSWLKLGIPGGKYCLSGAFSALACAPQRACLFQRPAKPLLEATFHSPLYHSSVFNRSRCSVYTEFEPTTRSSVPTRLHSPSAFICLAAPAVSTR